MESSDQVQPIRTSPIVPCTASGRSRTRLRVTVPRPHGRCSLREKGPALALLAVILAYAMCALVTRPRRTRSVASTTSTARRRRSSPSSWASCSPSPCWPTPLSEAPWPLSPPLPRRPRVLRVRREVIRWGRLCSACQPRRKEGVGPTISRRSRSADARQTSLPRAAHRPTRALPSRRGRGRAAVPAPPAPRPPRR